MIIQQFRREFGRLMKLSSARLRPSSALSTVLRARTFLRSASCDFGIGFSSRIDAAISTRGPWRIHSGRDRRAWHIIPISFRCDRQRAFAVPQPSGPPSDDAGIPQPLQLLWSDPAQRGQHLICMLPQQRRARDRGWRIRQFDRATNRLVGPTRRKVDIHDHFPSAQMWVRQHLRRILARPARDPDLTQ